MHQLQQTAIDVTLVLILNSWSLLVTTDEHEVLSYLTFLIRLLVRRSVTYEMQCCTLHMHLQMNSILNQSSMTGQVFQIPSTVEYS